MLVLLFFLSLSSETCHSQYVYGGIVPFDPRYAVRRPVRRSAMEALERLRLPVARYFPQMDTQVAAAAFPWRPNDMYALPAQWSDDYVPSVDEEETPDYGNYEYESAYRPQQVYAEEVYPQEVAESEISDGGPLYNDLMSSYLMEMPERPDLYENIQRRSDAAEAVHLDKVLEANEKAGDTTSVSTTPGPTPSTTTQPSQQQVQVTAVPAAPEKKNVKSLVVPDAVPHSDRSWRDEGQKEEPLFRPLQNSQRTIWSEIDLSPLSRAKNTQNKSPIPLLKQMIQNGGKSSDEARDPLLEELTNLKKKPGV